MVPRGSSRVWVRQNITIVQEKVGANDRELFTEAREPHKCFCADR